MYQASQRAMVQQANMILINIRTAEVAYFSSFFSNFGTQAAIVAGIICGAISQTPGLHEYPCAWVWVFTYFTASAASLVLACHVLLCCLFTSVFGQGLAIRGPLGSMVHTIDGMVKEQHQIVFSFVLTIAFFVVQEAGMFMIVMDYAWGIVCVVIVFASLAYTYNTTLRIYNRFYYEKEKVEWKDVPNPIAEFNDLNADADAAKNVPQAATESDSPKKPSTPKVDGKVVKGNSMFADPFHDYSSSTDGISGQSAKDLLAVEAFEGYLAVKTNKRFTTDPWERRYAVVTGHNLFFYKDKKTFTLNPADPINRRPVDLEGYAVHAGANELPYPITLTPVESDDIRKEWKFRCDTLAEFSMWKEIFATTVNRANARGAGGGGR